MKLDNVSFEAAVILGHADIAYEHYSQLQVGDILVLDQKVKNPVPIRIGENDYFFGYLGLINTHKGIKIYE